MALRRPGGITITLGYVLMGPLIVFVLHVMLFREIYDAIVGEGFGGAGNALMRNQPDPFILLVLAFYFGFGVVPAILAAEIEKARMRRAGAASWLHAAMIGGAVSVLVGAGCLLTEFPQLAVIGARLEKPGPINLPISFASGFIGTAVCWLVLRRRLARYATATTMPLPAAPHRPDA